MMLSVLGGDFRIKGGCPKLEIWLLLLKNGRTCNYLGLWLTDDIAYKFQFLEYTLVIHISMRGFHRNRIIKKSWIGYFCLSIIQLIVGNFNLNVWTQPGQDFKFQAPSHHYLNLAVVISMKILIFMQLIRDREKVYTIDSYMNKCHWHSPMREQLWRAL